MELHLDQIVSAIGGCAVAVILGRYAVTRALGDLDRVVAQVSDISKTLAAILVRLERINEHDLSIKELQRTVYTMEASSGARRNVQNPHVANLG